MRDAGAGGGGGHGSLGCEGEVYPALRRLERDCLVGGRWVDIGEDVPRRRYYALTPKGMRVVSGMRSRPAMAAPRGVRP
jgi:DNA-binding PadR family transcriptional regulator